MDHPVAMGGSIGIVDSQKSHVISILRLKFQLSSSRFFSLVSRREEYRVHREQSHNGHDFLTAAILLQEISLD